MLDLSSNLITLKLEDNGLFVWRHDRMISRNQFNKMKEIGVNCSTKTFDNELKLIVKTLRNLLLYDNKFSYKTN